MNKVGCPPAYPLPHPLALVGEGWGGAAGDAGRRDDIAVRPTLERPLSGCVIKTVSHSPEAMAAAASRTWIMNEQQPIGV